MARPETPDSTGRRRVDRSGWIAVGLLIMVVGGGLAGPWLTHADPEAVQLRERLQPPAWMAEGRAVHLLGTDSLGRDVWARVLHGARLSLLVGAVAALGSALLGTLLGLVAGYRGGFLDDAIMRIADIQLSFPFILLAITLMAVLGPGVANVVVVLIVSRWVDYARVVRGQTLLLVRKEFVEAARAQGASSLRIVLRHVFPNVVASVVIVGSFAVGSNIVYEASLSFLGMGVDPALPTWGSMLAEGRVYITKAWWLTGFPGLAILGTVLAINLVGDWVRDVLDPKHQAVW